MDKSKLHKRIMRRVYFVFLLQRVFSPKIMKLGAFSLSVVGLASAVSIGNVIANAPLSDLGQLVSFTVAAFAGTTAFVQALSLIAGVCLVWYMRDIFKAMPRPAFS